MIKYGTYSNLFTSRDIEKLDRELAHGLDVQRIIATTDAMQDGIEILEGPPEVEFDHWLRGHPAQIWKYPARRRT